MESDSEGLESATGLESYTADTETLKMACETGEINVVRHIVETSNIKVNNSHFISAALNDHIKVVTYLLYKFVDVNVFWKINIDENINILEIIKQLIKNGGKLYMIKYFINNYTRDYQDYIIPICCAANSGRLDIIKYLLSKESDVDCVKKNNALNAAIDVNPRDVNQLKIVKYLIKKGADDHIRSIRPLTNAAYRGHYQIFKYLIKKGAKYNYSIFCVCTQSNNFQILKYLMKKGANKMKPEYRNKKRTVFTSLQDMWEWPLWRASRNGNLDTVKYLLKNGEDGSSDKILRQAISHSHIDVAKCLLKLPSTPPLSLTLTQSLLKYTPFNMSRRNIKYIKYLYSHINVHT